MAKNPPAMQEGRVGSLSWEDSLEKEMTTPSSILVWESHGQYLHGGLAEELDTI